eukprot:CAMPEP_0168508360 /NCGR_PEP_ID=MMETSP0405-20121227/73_1 /TAXON_ID=498012 /ORGANISM="Trichosphaerium sp, Strain Am-I-7 wt" /LENGTH=139 /DNA_ID=CAMNT_0008525491 /DNA_START=53 /DNA_END=472 /DNA_ORIENTATION=+
MAYASGGLFAIAWWIWIDAATVDAHLEWNTIQPGHYFPGVFATIALIMVNLVSWTDLDGFGFGDDGSQKRTRFWLFGSFSIMFGALFAAVWLGIDHWFMKKDVPNSWPGIALILENVIIMCSALMYRFAKTPGDDYMSL